MMGNIINFILILSQQNRDRENKIAKKQILATYLMIFKKLPFCPQKDSSLGKSICCQVSRPEFDPQNMEVGGN